MTGALRGAFRSSAGLTLIEVVVVLAILAVAAAFVLPAVGRGTQSLRLRSEAGRVAALLREARQQAVTHRRATRVSLDRARSTVVLTADDPEQPLRQLAVPAGLRLSVAAGKDSLTFSPRGAHAGDPVGARGAGRPAARDPGGCRERAGHGPGGGRDVSRRREAGFTLFEVLIALVILSVAVVAALQLLGGGLRLARASSDHLAATLLATAKLSELAQGPLEEGTAEGSEGEYRWTRRVTLAPALLPDEPAGLLAERVRLARVSVEVSWGRHRRVELVTLRAWGIRR